MSELNLGYTGSIGIGTQSAFDTPVARTRWLRCFEVGLQRKPVTRMIEHLGAVGDLGNVHQSSFVEREVVGGPVSWPFAYNDASLSMLYGIMGSAVDAGSNPYTHTFKLVSPNPLVGYTIEQVSGQGTADNTDMAEIFTGCRLTQLELAWAFGQEMRATADIIARSGGGPSAIPSPTYGTPTWIQPNHMSTQLTFNGTAQRHTAARLTITRPQEFTGQVGSLFTAEAPQDRLMVTLDVDFLLQSPGWRTVFNANSQHDVTFSFTSGSFIGAFTLHNAKLVDLNHTTSAPGAIPATARFQGFSDGGSGDQGLGIVITNTSALYTAN